MKLLQMIRMEQERGSDQRFQFNKIPWKMWGKISITVYETIILNLSFNFNIFCAYILIQKN